ALNEVLLVWYRLLITVLTLFIVQLYRKDFRILSLKDTGKIMAGCIVALHWVAFYGSIKYANISVALTCFSSVGFFTAFLEPLLLKKKIVWIEAALGFLAIIGIYIIFDFHPHYKTGIIFGIIAAGAFMFFAIYNKLLTRDFSPKTIIIYEMSGGLLTLTFLIPLYLVKFNAAYYWPTASDWGWLVVLSWLCTIICFDLQLKALKKISAFTANLTYNLEPIYGIVLAIIIFKENKILTIHFYTGLGFIVIAIILQMARLSKRKVATN
ncbi:MAG: DMT family transporter, partial [Chitinophagaceae bacterium]|nr:DMT family transporter [Chitinophagaceae bacterium]